MKTNKITALASLVLGMALVALSTGCASTCGNSGGGIFGGPGLFANQPVRSTIRSWFQGDNCDTCNAPAGQPPVYNPNVAPLCEGCGGGGIQPATPLYGAPIGGAQIGTPALQGAPQPGPDGVIGNGVLPPPV